MAVAAVAVAVVVAALVFQRFTMAGVAYANFYDEEWVNQISEDNPDFLNAVAVIDEGTANQAPKLKEIMIMAYESKDWKFGRNGYADINIFDYNSIKAVSERNPLAAESFRQHDNFFAKYDGQYYAISVIRR
jgi:hypothetical protein